MRLILTVCLGYLMSFTPAFSEESAPETFNESLVIRSDLPNGNMSICSGALIEPDLVVTAAHCISEHSRHRVNLASRAQGWVFSTAIYHHPKYDPSSSLSAYDIGFIRLRAPVYGAARPKPVCRRQHAGESVYRVGFGGRDGYNAKMIFEMPQTNYFNSTQTLVLQDPYSASGDSGGPVYAIEDGQYCLLGVHSTVSLDRIPQLSYNPFIRAALQALRGQMGE